MENIEELAESKETTVVINLNVNSISDNMPDEIPDSLHDNEQVN